MNVSIIGFVVLATISSVLGYAPATLWCYRCVSTHPGCGDPYNWLWYWSKPCPEPDDKCVKVIEKKGGEEIITRDCLSSLRGHRTDIPADLYEGCRSNTKDVHLANYVNNTIKELDIYRDYYNSVKFCFCYFDNRCNSATSTSTGIFTTISCIFVSLLSILMRR